MKKRIIAVLATLVLGIALLVVAIPKEKTSEDLPHEAYQFFLENDFSPEQATSLVALIQNTSNFESTATSPDGMFFGLCQWGFARLDKLKDYATSKGKDPGDFYTQLEFIVSEVSPGENYQLVSYNGFKPEDWKNADNIEQATEALFWTYIRPTPSTPIDSLISYASNFED